MFLDERDRNLTRVENSRQSSMPREQMIGLLLEHRDHACSQRLEAGMPEHRELELPVAVDQVGVAIEVEPIFDILIERTKQTAVVEGAPLEQLLRFNLAGR